MVMTALRSISLLLGLRLIPLVIGLAVLISPASIQAQSPDRTYRVLVLYWDNKDFVGNVRFDESFKAVIQQSRYPGNLEYYPEYMETTRFQGKSQDFFRDYLRQKYEGRTIDVVVATADLQLNFLLRYRAELFPNSPLVFVATNSPAADTLAAGPGMTGVIHQSTHRETLALALKLHPNTKQVFVVSGSPERDKRYETAARRELSEFTNQVEITYLADLPLNELISRTASLPSNSIAMYVWQQSVNEQGRLLESIEVLARIAATASVPIYGMSSANLGQGLVGGYLQGSDSNGAKLAEITLRILSGTRPQDISVEGAPTVPKFDWRQLKRWGINESSLPPGSTVSFRQPTLWDQYKWYIIGIIAAFLMETSLIAWLLFMRARRLQAELESVRLASVAEAERRHLDDVVSNVPGIVWESRLDAITGTGKPTFISEYVQKILGYSVEEFLSTPGLGVNLVHEEDRERVIREGDDIGKNGGSIQFRWIAKDGRVVWAEAHLAPILDDTGARIGVRGVTLDVTERKIAEVARKQSEERNRAILQAIPDQMFLQTRDGVYLDYHSPREADLHLPPEEFLGKNMGDVLPPKVVRDLSKCFERAGEDDAQILEYELPRNGHKRWFEARVVQTGENVLSIVRDVTERKTAEDVLRQSEARFRNMADTSPMMIWVAGTDMLCTYVNKLWLDFTGRTIEEEVDTGWADGIHPDDYARALKIYNSAFDRREPFKMEYRLRRADGEYRWVFDSGAPRFSSQKEFLGYIGSCIDITDRREAEEELRRAHDELKQLKNQLEAENIYLQQELQLDQAFGEIVGQSDPIKYVLSKISQVAPTDATVLISGETGTGKELVARAIHAAGARKDRPLIRVNCAALTASLIESELFGHEKGAFTGAAARKLGRFELADRGTIFLDEIGELPLDLQVKLLRVLQEGEFERVGGSKTIKVDVRIIAATNRHLKLEVDKGAFREDLWYRLNVFPLTVPPLRQRKEDIPVMVDHFATKFAKRLGKTITSVSPRSLQRLQAHSWPGNVRELANVIERAVIHSQGSVLSLADSLEQAKEESPVPRSLEEMEREYIIRTLENTGWRVEGTYGAAKILGLNASTLRARMNKFGIQRPHAMVKGSDGS